MKTKTIALVAMLFSGLALANHHEGHAHGEDHGHGHAHKKKKVHVHGAIDLNYTYNFLESDTVPSLPFPGLSFGSADTFSHDELAASLVELNFSGSMNSLDWYIDLALGGQSKLLSAPSTALNTIVAQAYLTHHLSDDLSVTAGRMFTNTGFEGSYNKDNWNYSKSFAYQLTGPFAHDGIAAKYSSQSGFGAGLFLYDGSDGSALAGVDGSNDGKAVSAQLSYGHEMFGVVYNFFNDKNGVENYHNLNVTLDVSPMMSFAGSIVKSDDRRAGNTAEYLGWALYAKFNATKHIYVAPRFEMLDNDATGGNQLTSGTLTLGYNCEKSGQYRLEARYDKADTAIFAKKGQTALEESGVKMTAAWMYSF